MARGLLLLTASLLLTAGSVMAAPAVNEPPDPELRARLYKAVRAADGFSDRYEAEVWFVDMSERLRRYIPDDEERIAFLRVLNEEARRASLAPELVLALIEVESRFDRFAISSAGAQGYMQVMPFWLKEIGRPNDNLFSLRTNLRMGCTILRFYLDKEQDKLAPALARYNGSVGKSWYPSLVLTALHKRWRTS